MTARWGPLGWMTLHSISALYPDEPTGSDKQILNEFMDAFAATITCVHCRNDFGNMFSSYKKNIPSWSNSKRDLFLAICRMHNTLNKRLDKPIPKSVAECISFLINATKYTNQTTFRKNYIEYLFRDWNIYGRGTHYLNIAISNAKKMLKINEEYWNTKEVSYDSLSFPEDNVLSYQNQPTSTKIFFGKIKIKNVKWAPKLG
jgi:hypothetical protein